MAGEVSQAERTELEAAIEDGAIADPNPDRALVQGAERGWLAGRDREAIAFLEGFVAERLDDLGADEELKAGVTMRVEFYKLLAKAITMYQTGDPQCIGEFRTIARIAVEASRRPQDLQCTAGDEANVRSDTQPAKGAPALNGPGGSLTRSSKQVGESNG